jgi:hypothetical protein
MHKKTTHINQFTLKHEVCVWRLSWIGFKPSEE